MALGSEALIEEWSLGTEEILQRLNDDRGLLDAFFKVARQCSSFDRGSSFHSYTVCTTNANLNQRQIQVDSYCCPPGLTRLASHAETDALPQPISSVRAPGLRMPSASRYRRCIGSNNSDINWSRAPSPFK